MKRILVPTDFSSFADKALQTAILWAKHYGGKVQLFHCIQIAPNEEIAQESIDALKDEIDDQFQNILNRYQDVELEYVIEQGLFLDEFVEQVAVFDPDIVIMGSHGKVGWQEVLAQTNTQKAVRSIHAPLLVIKENIPNIPFKKVVYASNFNVSEKTAFEKWVNQVKTDDPKVLLVNVKQSALFQAPKSVMLEAMDNFAALAAPLSCEKHIISSDHVEASVLSFVEEHQADVVVISNHERRALKRLLSGSTVENLINHSLLPVWSIDY